MSPGVALVGCGVNAKMKVQIRNVINKSFLIMFFKSKFLFA